MGKGGCLAPAVTKKKLREVTLTELAEKNSVDECWIAYEGDVLDVTEWLVKHPGGIRPIMSAAGSDASSVIKSLHSPDTLSKFMKHRRKVGVLVEEDTETAVKATDGKPNARARAKQIHKDFEALNQELLDDGWFEAQPSAYIIPIIRVAAFLFFGSKMVVWSDSTESSLGSLLFLVFGSILLGMFLQNIAFMGHDAGHASVTGNIQKDIWFGLLVGNAFSGVEVRWWKSTHYVHHSATNSLHDDPDIQHMPVLCYDERMGGNLWSSYHGKTMKLDSICRALLPYQHWYFYPLMAIARINLYLQSIIYLIQTCPFFGDKTKKNTLVKDEFGKLNEVYAWPTPSTGEWLASVTSLVFYWTMLYSFFSQLEVKTAIASFTICHLMSGLLHVQILMSHVAMHYCADGHGTTEAITAPNGNNEAGYYEWQALSTMDVECHPWMDWFHGGLQFQLEHHLFPRVPRWHLRKLCERTDKIFEKYDIKVVRVPFIEGNKRILSHMKKVGTNVSKMKSV